MPDVLNKAFSKIGEQFKENVKTRRRRRDELAEARHQASLDSIKKGKIDLGDKRKKDIYGF